MATGLESWKLAKALYVVPVLFAYTPFIGGNALEVAQIFVFGLVGLYAISAAFQGHLEARLSWPARGLMLAVAFALIWPIGQLPGGLVAKLAAVAAFAALFFVNARTDLRDHAAKPGAPA